MTLSGGGSAGGERSSELEVVIAKLERRQRGFRTFLRVRAAVGLMLLGLASVGALLTLTFLAAGLGWAHEPSLRRWTTGFDAVLAVFLPGAFTFLCGRTGLMWWRGRRGVEFPGNKLL